MRKYHRWLAILFGIFMLWIGATGVMIQFADIVSDGQEEHGPPPAGAAAASTAITPAKFVCPPDMSCRHKPDPKGAKAWVGFLQHLHSGESFGPLGTAISILSGFALMFFSVSGLWMYIQMWRNRKSRDLKPGWFWN